MNKLGLSEAAHEEQTPDGNVLIINKLNCSLVGKTQRVRLTSNTKTQKAYAKETVIESFRCNYGLNEEFRDRIEAGGMKIAGLDDENKVRVLEIPNHRFFIVTLYLPQLTSTSDSPHPLIVSLLKSAIGQAI